MLANLVSEIVRSRSAGLKHCEIVKEVLRSGYRHDPDAGISLSEEIYEILKKLVNYGKICQIQNEKLERRYKANKTAIEYDDCLV